MEVTLNIPEELVDRLRPLQNDLPRIIELGLRALDASQQAGFRGIADVMEVLAGLPTPDEVLALRPSPALQARIDQLLEKNRTDALSAGEETEWAEYEYIEHLIRMAKAKAALKRDAT